MSSNVVKDKDSYYYNVAIAAIKAIQKETAQAIFEELTKENTIWEAIGYLSVSGEHGKRMSKRLDKILNRIKQKYLGDAT